ncbi:hypothetical protein MMC14_000824 [Varicellaria rhodocarpa]|nr:hypothetical protein [Varicellaria rhodocarpa]
MDALILDAPAGTAHVQRVPIPEPANDDLLVRVYAIALNPVDALYTAKPLGKSGRIVGSDFAGVVEKRGPAPVASGSIEIGHRVAGFLQGACSVNDRPGAFTEFLTVPSDLVWRVPDEMAFEEAATIFLCSLTAAQCLFYRFGLGAPFD